MFAFVLLGPIMADREYKDGEVMEMCESDLEALSKWGIVRVATEAESPVTAPPEPIPTKGKKAVDLPPEAAPVTDLATKP